MKKIVFLLLIFCVALVQAQDTASQDESSLAGSVVISLGETAETLSDFNSRFEIAIRSLAASRGIQVTPELRAQLVGLKPQFLERRATELVILQEAAARAVTVDDAVVETQVAGIKASIPEGRTFEEFLADAGFTDEAQFRSYVTEVELLQNTVDTMRSELEVTDEAISSFYETNILQFTEEVCARHILLDTEEDARTVLADLAEGADFATLAQERSTGPSGPTGGDLGCYGTGRMVPEFETASFAGEVDEPIGPVPTQFGFHVILVYEKTVTSLEDARESIISEVQGGEFDLIMEALRNDAGVQLFPDVLAAEATALAEAAAAAESDAEEGADEDSSEGTEDSEESSE